MLRPSRIVSGGQTGADQGGLFAAEDLGIPTGGWAPKGYRTERGPMPELLRDRFKLQEAPTADYAVRTRRNVVDADGTIIFGDVRSAGSWLTQTEVRMAKRPLLINPPSGAAIRAWMMAHGAFSVNVAGNRESKNPGLQERVRKMLVEAFR